MACSLQAQKLKNVGGSHVRAFSTAIAPFRLGEPPRPTRAFRGIPRQAAASGTRRPACPSNRGRRAPASRPRHRRLTSRPTLPEMKKPATQRASWMSPPVREDFHFSPWSRAVKRAILTDSARPWFTVRRDQPAIQRFPGGPRIGPIPLLYTNTLGDSSPIARHARELPLSLTKSGRWTRDPIKSSEDATCVGIIRSE